ncbi:DUF2290 domain-containing protein [Nocardioides sp. NPDC057772]|uniref:DUF2290 domain-containing protein n=1 Tax=Nocardioides sp. NPDC057772 TaxID=3346245 RepID=UPI003670EF92
MTTTARAIADSVQNILDYLIEADLALYTTAVAVSPGRVTFTRYQPDAAFLIDREHPGIDQYMAWVTSGSYSAVLLDGALLQFTYTLEGGEVTGHRLAYIPCPFAVDPDLLASGEPLADIIDIYRDGDALLRSPIRFDFDPEASKAGHPAAHMTLNGVDCRIAAVAPVHALRFADFVFRNFYAELWVAHQPFFSAATARHLGPAVITDVERQELHVAWDTHSKLLSA